MFNVELLSFGFGREVYINLHSLVSAKKIISNYYQYYNNSIMSTIIGDGTL